MFEPGGGIEPPRAAACYVCVADQSVRITHLAPNPSRHVGRTLRPWFPPLTLAAGIA